MIGKTKEEFLDWWNNLVPSALWLSPEDYDRILVNPITPCNIAHNVNILNGI